MGVPVLRFVLCVEVSLTFKRLRYRHLTPRRISVAYIKEFCGACSYVVELSVTTSPEAAQGYLDFES